MSLVIKVPPVGESISEVTLSQWVKKDGDYVEMDEVIAELESDKATFELTAEKAGILKLIAKEGDTLEIGADVCSIEEGEQPVESKPAASASGAAPVKEEEKAAPANNDAKASGYAAGTPSPAAAKILAEKGIDAASVAGTGVGGRVTKEDALKAEQGKKEAAPAGKPAPAVASKASVPGSREERREKMSSLRRTVAKRLVAVRNETAMLTTFNEVDMQPIMELRSKYKEK